MRAPLTGIVLIVEMTGNYAQMLPLLVACFCAYIVAEGLHELPIYENLLESARPAAGRIPCAPEPNRANGFGAGGVEPGAPFDGCELRELGSATRLALLAEPSRDDAHLRVDTDFCNNAADPPYADNRDGREPPWRQRGAVNVLAGAWGCEQA